MLSRNEDILYAIINGEVYEKVPQSRMEALLLELKDVIEAGGGGSGGTTNYNLLVNKPSINGVILSGDKTTEELNIQTGVGLNTTGTQYTVDGQELTAGEGAEIFNDYSDNIAAGGYSHAEGSHTTASGIHSHAEGRWSFASAEASHAEGYHTAASGTGSHA
ncbi:MAG: hypothetical protein IJ644_11850, partial [Oscillospiraceae bacterium]|nr:hypothetical protein [Oscillospiraceae bacterium]